MTDAATNQPSEDRPGFFRRLINALFGGGAKPATPVAQPGGRGRNATRPTAPVQSTSARNPRPATLDLEASAFLPISRTDLLSAAKQTTLWSSPWFGRRDLIPPVEDPRTRLIDRAMVTQGMITREQLAEIHRVGMEMDRHRPDALLIRHKSQQAGKEAVEAERQARREAKQKKRDEAAANREARRAAIAERRASDILFLGRGVSGRLGDRESDRTKLDSLALPFLATPAEIAAALSLTIPRLRWLAFHADVVSRTHYVSFQIPKKSGGMRTISAPHRTMAAAQKWVLCEILNMLPVESCAHGFIHGRSILTNAQPHVGRDVVINMDLEGFFPGITFPRVRRFFARLGYSPSVATILALLCTECPRRSVTFSGEPFLVATGPRGLPQGACTSPAISNQIARRLDLRLQGLATKMDLTYTRYADDITFSGGENLQNRIGYVMARIRHIASDEGFTVNEKKSRVLRQSTAQSVTGLIVNDKPSISRQKLRRIRSILHHAQTEGVESQNREGHPNFRAWLEGSIAFISMTRPELGADFRRQLQSAG